MGIYAIANQDGMIVNRIVLDDPADWPIPDGYTIHQETGSAFEIGGSLIDGAYTAPVVAPPPPPPPKTTVASQDLLAQFTVADYGLIKIAIAGSDPMALMWAQVQAQKDPMMITNARFLAGWAALIQVLGQPRMSEIAGALGVTIGN